MFHSKSYNPYVPKFDFLLTPDLSIQRTTESMERQHAAARQWFGSFQPGSYCMIRMHHKSQEYPLFCELFAKVVESHPYRCEFGFWTGFVVKEDPVLLLEMPDGQRINAVCMASRSEKGIIEQYYLAFSDGLCSYLRRTLGRPMPDFALSYINEIRPLSNFEAQEFMRKAQEAKRRAEEERRWQQERERLRQQEEEQRRREAELERQRREASVDVNALDDLFRSGGNGWKSGGDL